jgi:nickel/cobalt transporter (NicO) family protein
MKRWLFPALFAAILALGRPPPRAEAHPLGTFTINQYSRIEVSRDTIHLRYVVDMAEIPALDELIAIDTNRDETVSGVEQATYLARQASALVRGLRLTVGGSPADLHVAGQELVFPRAAGSLYTLRLALDLEASLKSTAQPIEVEYRDGNFADRLGWREIVVRPRDGVVLRDSTAPTQDQSDELRVYPQNLLSNPPDVREARFSVTIGVPAPPARRSLLPPPSRPRIASPPRQRRRPCHRP